ncbi:MAG TPA: IPT/TIG domain-containing protein, partial [Edaphobacter sp.]
AVQGLPSGVSAKIQPAQSLTGESATITLTADTTATPHQNLPITVTGAVDGTDVSASQTYSLNVTNGPGTIPNNRTAFTSTEGTPSGVVFDRAHNLVFASNSLWNRIDVISNLTHKIERSIPIASPTAIDLSQDAETLWIGTKSQQVFALNTSSFTLRKYTLPDIPAYFWATGQLFALSNGDLLIVATGSYSSSILQTFVWSPASGTTNKIVMDYAAVRSGDGSKVFGLSTGGFNGCSLQVYSVAQGTAQAYTISSGPSGSSYCGTLHASNRDGSMLVGNIGAGIQLLDGTGQPLDSFTPALTPGTLVTREQVFFNASAFHFSDDGTLLYQTGSLSNYTNLLATYDVATRALLGLAPAITSPVPPLSGGYGGPTALVDVDPTGMLIGIQNFGVAFEDATYFQNLGTSSVRLAGGTPTSFAPQSGPLAGGTEFGVNAYNTMLPDVWFGDIRGTASISANSLSLTSPAGAAPGPVDLKVIYPNGLQGYVAQGFSYGPLVQNMVYSGSSPTGGAPATLTGFGLPVDGSGGSVTVGGSAATITSVVEQYPPWTGESVQSTFLKFTLPAGTPGFADLQVQTPNGSSTLPRAIFYASSVNSYAFTETPSAVIYDKKRNRAYVLTKTQVLVFDAGAGAFLSPMNVPTANGVFDLRDAALSIDANYLVVSNSGDGSVAVLDLESPGSSYALALPDLVAKSGNCSAGPVTVAAVAGGKTLVLPESSSPGCGSPGYAALINIQGHSSSSIPFGPGAGAYSLYMTQAQSNGDGTLVLIKLGNNSSSSYSPTGGFGVISSPIGGYSESISADGNLLTADLGFFDASGRALGTVAQPQALYGYALTPEYPPDNATIMLRGARLNAAGSLYFVPHTGYFEIIDTLTATLRMRFSLSETMQDVNRPIAIDEGGKQIFLLTSAGLTVVNMGQAPLSVGHLGTAQPVSGGVIQLRGSGFDADTTVMVDTSSASASLVDENTMNITLPSLPSGPHNLTLQRTDGSSITARGLIFIP